MGGRLDPAVAAVRSAVRVECGDLAAGSSLVVACSGGPDSMALAAATVFEARKAGWLAVAAVVDHQLQPDSFGVADAVAAQLGGLGFESVTVLTVDVGGAGGPEGAARSARYAALERFAAENQSVVLLGHTRDDQAESVLLGLARGSGLRSLSGMPVRRGIFRRPLLSLARETTVRACIAEGIDVWDDPHNHDDRFARVRVRKRLLPAIEAELGPGVADALARTARQARDDADALDEMAAQLAAEATRGRGVLDVATLTAAPTALRRRVLRKAAIDAGSPAGDLSFGHVLEIERLVSDWRGQSGVDLPGSVTASRRNTGDKGAVVSLVAKRPSSEG